MNVVFSDTRPTDATSHVLPATKGGVRVRAGGDGAIDAGLEAAASLGRFEGDAGQIVEHIAVVDGNPQRWLLLGLGSGTGHDAVKAGSALTARLQTLATSVAIDASGVIEDGLIRLLEGAVLRGWHYHHRTKVPANQQPTLETLVVVGATATAQAAWADAEAVTAGVGLTRELITEPANIIYPVSFVERCRRLEALGVEIEVLGEAEMTAAGMGALVGVGQGSDRESQLLVMKWDGTGGAVDTPVVLIGKGVTFDTGGISLKPPAGMEDMKWDMGGAGAVAGAMMALAGRKAKAHVVAVCGLVENMPDGKATRPGDVVTSMSGQTIEVINTDAEGRLVLCDAMTWAQRRYSPKVMVDLATLTGAMIVTLGHEHGGIFSNDDALAGQLIAAGDAVGDPLWRLPMGEAYDKMIESPIADMKNVGPREAGSITAAQFLKRYVDDGVAWAHLDIAGMVWSAKAGPGWDKGATGYGVRLLDRFIADNFEK